MPKRLKAQASKGYVKKWKKDKKEVKDKVTICYTPGIVPDVMRVCLPYFYLGNISGTGIVANVFRGNSLFDPDFTGVGSQPLGRDEWSAFYRRYRVLASKVTITATTTDTGDSTILFIQPMNTSSILVNRIQILEQEHGAQKMLATSTGMNRATVSQYMDTASMRGIPKAGVRINNELSAASGSNPNEQFFWHVGVLDTSSLVDTITADIMVKIEYYVEFFDRETLSQS